MPFADHLYQQILDFGFFVEGKAMCSWVFVPIVSLAFTFPVLGAEVHVLSGGALEPGLVIAIDAFHKETGNEAKISFATAPEIQRRVGAGETPDVVIAPPAVLDAIVKSGKLEGRARVEVGRVGIGVAVRDGAPKPDISTTDAFKRAVLDADSLVYNRASSGLSVERLLRRLGLAEQTQAKTTRYAGSEMLERVIQGKGKEIAFSPVTEILLYRGKGLQLVGPLPAEIQSYTTYAAEPVSQSETALAFVRFLGTPAAKAIFVSAGIE
jgi:molybdate transport system substrate-binding protein